MPNHQNENQGSAHERLSIKIILPQQGKERKVQGGGSPPKPFRVVDPSFRKSLSTRIKAIEAVLRNSVDKIDVAPARVRLLPKAFAKSHRPESIFSQSTCPIIGAGKPGELFIKVTVDGLEKVDSLIEKSNSDKMLKEISSIETIEPITSEFRLAGSSPEDILRLSLRIKEGYLTKIQLFDFVDIVQQKKLLNDFIERCSQRKITVSQVGYSAKSNYFSAICKEVKDIEYLAGVVSVRSIKCMPIIMAIHSKTIGSGELPVLPEPTVALEDYPVVAVVDSGITDTIPQLNKWIVGRESVVPPAYRNTQHGTFVGGLICWAKELNPGLKGIDSTPCSIFDLQVIPNSDPSQGEVDYLSEIQLLQDLETHLKIHAKEIKVWNLSLGTNEICDLDNFSSLAVELDKLQEKYNVTFVLSAGNYTQVPLLTYPRIEEQLINGRITTPADSILGVTVGAVAHRGHSCPGPKEGEPSAFSRHGAGPNYIIKPDLVHYGGTCDINHKESFGVCSIDGTRKGENLGTSFSAPLVSRQLANIYHNITPTPSPVLARAILTHHARDPRTEDRVPDEEVNYLGFGMPGLINCLDCSPWCSTFVFQDFLRPGYYLEWDNFPYPPSLTRENKYFGDIWMTLAFAPTRDEKWGTEYCETHIEAHMGVYLKQKSRSAGVVSTKFKGLVPPEYDNPEDMYESYQVRKLRKWAPVRTYFGSLGKHGHRGERWRLKVGLLTRHGIDVEMLKSQPFALIITIADPNRQAPVYDEMTIGFRNKFKTENLVLRAAPRIQARQ